MNAYAFSDSLVSTQWTAESLSTPESVRVIESNEDILLYDMGHIPGAVKIDWTNDLQNKTVRDFISTKEFEELCSALGIRNDSTLVFYGDKNNWWACYAFWVFRLFGHENVRIMNGGRKKWIAEGRTINRDVPTYPRTTYEVSEPHPEIRAFREDVMQHIAQSGPLVDVRSPAEFTGQLLHMPEYPQEGALRGGHIPGALNVPWSRAVNDDGTFRSRKELEDIYMKEFGLKRDDDVIAYCRIGERSSLTWFVMSYLLGFPKVRNYDGSWTEWGNMVGVPVEKGSVEPRGRA